MAGEHAVHEAGVRDREFRCPESDLGRVCFDADLPWDFCPYCGAELVEAE